MGTTMASYPRIDRARFLSALAALPLATLGAATLESAYVCPPCGLACDKLAFSRPGACPACGMSLIPKSQRSAPYGLAQFPNHARSGAILLRAAGERDFSASGRQRKRALSFRPGHGVE